MTVEFEYLLEANVLLKMLNNYSSSPPIPISASEKSGLKILIPDSPSYLIVINLDPLIFICVSYVSFPVLFMLTFYVYNPV